MLKSQNYPAQNTKCKDNERKAKDKEKDIPVQWYDTTPTFEVHRDLPNMSAYKCSFRILCLAQCNHHIIS